ncbi:MAG: serine hydrolase domain-containing protein [Bacteroidales bacterium]|nr:serine hydrolase domain-containing protein [Bacteroidales bacterium]
MRLPLFSLMLLCFLLSGSNLQASNKQVQNVPPVKTVINLHRLDKNVDRLMKNAVAKDVLPSAVCYVAYHGKPIYYKSFGLADRENDKKLKKDAIFRMASQTKLITTVALMTLYEQGLFSLEDPVKKFLPEFSNPVVYVSGTVAENNLVTRPADGDITIRQLLSHSSGLGYNTYNQDLQIINYAEQVTTKEVVERIAKLPLQHDPGNGFTYGFSIDVVGHLAEVISGMRLDSLIKNRVLDPLDMEDTYFYLPPKKFDRLVPLYQKPEQDAPVALATNPISRFYPLAQNKLYFGGGAGLSGTIEDYAHLCQMILDKGVYHKNRILSRKTIEQMCSDQLFGAEGNYKFGLGLEIATEETFARTMKTPGSLCWGGYYGTEYMIDPENELVILFYTNRESWQKNDIWGDFLRAVMMSLN